MTSFYLYKLIKAATRRVIWRLDGFLSLIGFSLVILDVENLRKLSLSRRTPGEKIEYLLKRLRPVNNGWPLVRVGKSEDGGYLIPEDLADIGRCMSAGCDKNWTFEKSLHSSYGITSSILDSEDKRPFDLDECHKYLAKWLGNKNGTYEINFDSWVKEYSTDNNSDLILQMDIEGFEWQALSDVSLEVLGRFRIMTIEFHGSQNLFNKKLFKTLYEPTINRILLAFDVVHLHPNNCCGIRKFGNLEFPNIFEVTFHRKERAIEHFGFTELPNNLDVKNVPYNPEIFINWSPR